MHVRLVSVTGIPEGLAADPPGPARCAALAGLDRARLANADTVDALQAWRRLRSYADAQELAVMAEVGRCDPVATPGRRPGWRSRARSVAARSPPR